MTPLQLTIEREYISRVKKKSFIILTIFMPFLFVAIALVPALLAMVKDRGEKVIAVSDATGLYLAELKSDKQYKFVAAKADESESEEYFAVVNISADLSENPKAVSFVSEKQPPLDLTTRIEHALSEKVKQQKLDKLIKDGSADSQAIQSVLNVIDDRNNSISLTTFRKEKRSGEVRESSTIVATIVGGVFTLMIYMFIMVYGGMVMQAVMEEKKNRIVEVLVSSIKPVNLLVGKIIGIGLVGITQLLIWGVLVSSLMAIASLIIGLPQMASQDMGVGMAEASAMAEQIDPSKIEQIMSLIIGINWFEIIIMFMVYFIGGYMIYASLFAMIGAAVDNDQDTQQFMLPITIIIMFAFYAAIYSVQNPDGPLAYWCSIIPFTSPIVMMVRLPFGVPLWEKLLSVALLYGTFAVVAWGAAKIYRVGILMYGKKPTIKEMIKWMKYK